MDIEILEKRFSSYLDKFWKLSDIAPFLLVYIRLLFLFKDEISQDKMDVLLERQKQLRGEKFSNERFYELMKLSRKEMDRDVGANASATREAMINRLLFCAFLDTEENDFFYLIEPIFGFARAMEVSSDLLRQILESEFDGFKV